MKRIRLALALAGVIALASTLSTSAQAPPEASGKPRKLTMSSQGLTIAAKLGSSCLPAGNGSLVCADTPFDPTPTRGRLPVRPGGTLAIRTGAEAVLVSVELIRTEGGAKPRFIGKARRAQRVKDSRHRWSIELPAAVRRANIVNVFVRYRFGDASFSAHITSGAACSRAV